jgi:hypothetical protein
MSKEIFSFPRKVALDHDVLSQHATLRQDCIYNNNNNNIYIYIYIYILLNVSPSGKVLPAMVIG